MKHLWFFKLWGYIIYGNYPCDERSHYLFIWQGWGMVREENPKLGAGRVVDQMAPWESFQVLGPHSGVNICDTNSIKRSVYTTTMYNVLRGLLLDPHVKVLELM